MKQASLSSSIDHGGGKRRLVALTLSRLPMFTAIAETAQRLMWLNAGTDLRVPNAAAIDATDAGRVGAIAGTS
jgi:hypothetical protein